MAEYRNKRRRFLRASSSMILTLNLTTRQHGALRLRLGLRLSRRLWLRLRLGLATNGQLHTIAGHGGDDLLTRLETGLVLVRDVQVEKQDETTAKGKL
jgi:hypothetical protein